MGKKTLRILTGLLMILSALLPAPSCLGEAEAEDPEKIFTFSLIGDCTVGEQVQHQGYKNGYTARIREAGMDYPFSLAADLFAKDDLTVANCEGNLTNYKRTNT